MRAFLELLRQPWPWWAGGLAIGSMVPLLLLLANRQFGISSVKRRSSAGDGFHATDFGSAGSDFAGLDLVERAGWAGRALAEERVSVI